MLYSSSLKYSDWRKISSGILRIYLEEANFQFVRARLLVYMIHALWPWTVMTIIPIHCWSITPVDTITTNKIDMHAIIIIGRYSKSNRVIASSPTQWYRECFCSKWINNAISAIYLLVSYIFSSTCMIMWSIYSLRQQFKSPVAAIFNRLAPVAVITVPLGQSLITAALHASWVDSVW